MRPCKRFEMVELVVPANATATRFNFPDIPQLRSDVTKDIWVRAIETFSNLSITFDFNGNPVAAFADIQTASLTLYVQGSESIFRLPLIKLLNTYQLAVNPTAWTDALNQFDNLEIDWTKSYISTPVAFSTVTQFAFVLGVSYYQLPPGTLNTIKKACGIPDSLDIPPGYPMPRLNFENQAPGSFQ